MKRSRHRWLGIGLFCVALAILSADVPVTSAARATSLFFAKTSTTTAAPDEEPTGSEDEAQVEPTAEEATNTTSKLSGIPQIDYIYDPNLPRELNGYNLSEYPFYETVPPPETMDFKCDGLHDGFYASIPHKCQVYHHCLFGTRYDFLCANYTAFDQKTFICQFVSEVDCKNSANYFSRNEALYKAASTEPPSTTTTTTTTTTTVRPPRPGRRRPPPRYDYYDDDYYYPRDDYDYEERGGRRNRPRSRPGKRRPVDDYDDRYETRPRPRDEPEEDYNDRRSYDRPRPGKRPYSDNRRPYDDEERRPYKGGRRPGRRDEEEDRYPADDVEEERPRGGKRGEFRPRDKTRSRDEDRGRDEVRSSDEVRPKDEITARDEIKPRDETRPRDEIRPRDEVRSRDEIRPRDEVRSRDEIRPRDETRTRDEIKPRDEVRPRDDVRARDEVRSRDDIKSRDERRPLRDDTTAQDSVRPRDRFQSSEGRRLYDRPARGRDERPYLKPERNYDSEDRTEEKRQVPSAPDGQSMVKPNGHGIFSKPRPPPKIKRPVPINEKDKYDYVPVATTKAPYKADDDYYEEYEEDDVRKPLPSAKTSTVQQRPKSEPVEKEKFKPTRPHYPSPAEKVKKPKKPIDYDEEEYYYEPPAKSEKYTQRGERPSRLKDDDYYYDEKEKTAENKKKTLDEDVTVKVKEVRPGVKVIRRPFLPSRGGSPYLPRGLQPVAGKNLRLPPNTTPKPTTTSTTTTTTTSTTTTTTTTPKPTTTTTERTTTTTTEKPTTTERLTTTERTTTTIATEKPSTTAVPEEEYEYYDEEDIEYEAKDKKQPIESLVEIKEPPTTTVLTTTNSRETTTYDREQFLEAIKGKPRVSITAEEDPIVTTNNEGFRPITTDKPRTNLDNARPRNPSRNEERTRYSEIDDRPRKPLTTDERAKNLASKVLKNYNDNYDAIKEQLESTLTPGDYLKPYLSQLPTYREAKRPEIKPEISKGYTATGKPLKIPDIKQNLADSIENEYDVRLNEALAPTLPVRIPSGFVIPSERDYTFSRFRNNLHAEPQFAASELSHYQVRKRPQISGVSIRTPTSYYLQPQRLVYDESLVRPSRQLYRQLGNIF